MGNNIINPKKCENNHKKSLKNLQVSFRYVMITLPIFFWRCSSAG